MEKIEIWKDIIGYEGLYQVSSFGRVKSLGNGKTWNKKERILKQGKINKGYCQVSLCKDKKQKHYLIHRLVAQTFIPNPQNLPCVNHKDENPSNNCVDNLEWVTQKQNCNYGSRNERISKANSISHKGLKHTQEHKDKISKAHQKTIVQLSKNNKFIKNWESAKQASETLGIDNSNISNCLKGRYNSAGKYKWKYLSDYINEQIQYLNELKEYRNRLNDILKKAS